MEAQTYSGEYFCLKCGEQSFLPVGRKKLSCKSCGFEFYRNAACAVAAVIRCGNDIVVVKRAKEPEKGMLDLPGGFVDPGETLEEGLTRELAEELGLSVTPDQLRYISSGVNVYPYGGVEYDTTDAFFELRLTEKPRLTAMDDIASCTWSAISELPMEQFAFQSQQKMLAEYYLDTL